MLEKLKKRIKDFFYTKDVLDKEVLDIAPVVVVIVAIVAICALIYITTL